VLATCCGPIVSGDREAPTAEALMRSRFTAFALGDTAHLRRSWDEAQRPSAAELESSDEDLRWQKLRILDVVGGGPDDAEGIVEFVAIARGSAGKVRLHERSRFRRVGTAPGWVYVDGEIRD
jgi:SEC-C motif-containing protein